MSDLFSMNDFLEIHWGYSVWEKVAGELIHSLGYDFLDKVDKIIHSTGLHGLLVATCFSQDGDVLSQWRAYADDGKGYAIGFYAKDILKLPIRALKILYNEAEQIDELRKAILAIYETEKKSPVKFSKDFATMCYVLAYDLAAFKNPAFSEEKEVRTMVV
jgi:Protein of unknown function (DUF2971)